MEKVEQVERKGGSLPLPLGDSIFSCVLTAACNFLQEDSL